MFGIFIFTGCTVNYNLKISDNVINEKISIQELSEKIDTSTADRNLNNTYSQYNNKGVKKYNTSKVINGNKTEYNLNQTYYLDSVSYIRAFDECFDAYNIVYVDDTRSEYLLQTSKGFKCMTYEYNTIDSYVVNIEIDKKVISHNADSVKGNVYTWNINKNNAADKIISIQFKNDLLDLKSEKEEK